MPITPENFVRHELVGLRVRIAESSDPACEKISGRVIDETYGTLKIEAMAKTKRAKAAEIEKKSAREKVIPKNNTIFIFTLPNKTKVQVDGRLLVGRPEDRIKKKFARW